MKFFAKIDSPENPAIVTPFFMMHYLWSFWFSIALSKYLSPEYNFSLVMIVHGLYEAKDALFSKTNSLPNSIGDTIASILGWYSGYFLHGTVSNISVLIFLTLIVIIHVLLKEPHTYSDLLSSSN